ncbi:MAG: Ku protein, partial [Bryobacteraceae bacterium]|nr:Ku protein [Bryobacteraceae bacterium]
KKELDLALLLVNNLEAAFDPAKYHDSYKERVEALIQAKIAGQETVAAPAPKPAAVVNILEALQKSLEASGGRKPPTRASDDKPAQTKKAGRKA